jgi:class 3 adenylate cyclase/tetratricopeptide (TPR) repeat protein
VFQVLAYLLAQADRIVSKQELCEQVWPRQFISDAALESVIKAVRQAIGDNGRDQRLIQTVYGQGYRFLAAVAVHPEAPAGASSPDGAGPRHLLSTPPQAIPDLVPGPAPQAPGHPADGDLTMGASRADASLPPYAIASIGEWKLITVLCCALAEPPPGTPHAVESYYRALHALAACAQETVQRYGGTLQPVIGADLLALFGAPQAQEDHARCAVLAALDLQQRLRQDQTLSPPAREAGLTVRLGIHSGLGVVGTLGPAASGPVTAVGAPTQGARWLQQQAAPGMLLVSAATYHLVQDEVQGELWGHMALEESPAPLAVYAVQGLVHRRAGVSQRPPLFQSPFVGRQRELALLYARLEVVRTGDGQVVSLVGPPGIGKTRLLREFARGLAPDQVTWVSGQCLPYGQTTPYLPVRDVLQDVCSLAAGAPAETRAAALRRRLAALGEGTEEDVVLVGQVLDLPVASDLIARLPPEAQQARTFALLGHLIRQAAQAKPLVLAVENLHWMDPTSAAWLGFLVERLAGTAVLLLVTARPGYQLPWGAHAAVTQLALPPLQTTDSQAIVAAVPGAAQLPVARCQQIVTHGAGNPFFVEELVWDAVAHGPSTTPVPVPATVHAVLAARIDRLPAAAKALLQMAAVLGPEVPVPLLQAIAERPEDAVQQGLAHLEAAQVLYEMRLVPERVYTFKHALTQEVAYSTLLQAQRRTLHARVVEALEALEAAPVEWLAHHALRGEVWEKAVIYGQQAGARAHDRAALREAQAWFEQALQALAHLPEDGDTRALAIDLRLALGRVLQPLGAYERCRVLLSEAEVLARTLDDRYRLARVLSRLTQVRRITGDLDGAMAGGQQVYQLAVTLGERVLRMRAAYILGEIYYVIGDFGQAAELLRHNVEATDQKFDRLSTDLWIDSQAWLARTLSMLGAFAEGRRHGEAALHLARLDGREETPITAHACLGSVYLAQGDLTHAVQVLEQGLALCRVSGNRSGFLRVMVAGLGYAAALQGRLAEGRTLLEEAIGDSIRIGARHAPHRIAWLSEVCRRAGRSAEALQHARQALELARQQQVRGEEALALHQLGVVQAHAACPETAQAVAHYWQALALAEALGMRPLQAHCHRGLGMLYVTTGQHEQAGAELSIAMEMYRGMEMTFWCPETEAALAQVDAR